MNCADFFTGRYFLVSRARTSPSLRRPKLLCAARPSSKHQMTRRGNSISTPSSPLVERQETPVRQMQACSDIHLLTDIQSSSPNTSKPMSSCTACEMTPTSHRTRRHPSSAQSSPNPSAHETRTTSTCSLVDLMAEQKSPHFTG